MEHVSSVRPTGKFPEKVENLKKWARFPGWNFRREFRVPFTRFSWFVQVPGPRRAPRRPGFTTKWNNFLPIRKIAYAPTEISGFFFPQWKAP